MLDPIRLGLGHRGTGEQRHRTVSIDLIDALSSWGSTRTAGRSATGRPTRRMLALGSLHLRWMSGPHHARSRSRGFRAGAHQGRSVIMGQSLNWSASAERAGGDLVRSPGGRPAGLRRGRHRDLTAPRLVDLRGRHRARRELPHPGASGMRWPHSARWACVREHGHALRPRRHALPWRLASFAHGSLRSGRSGSCSKLLLLLFVFLWLRATLPRLRYDQLMRFGRNVLLLVATINALRRPRSSWCGSRLRPELNPVDALQGFGGHLQARSSRSRLRGSTRSTSARSTRASATGIDCAGARTGSRSASAARSAPPPARPTASASSPPRTRPEQPRLGRASATRGSTRST